MTSGIRLMMLLVVVMMDPSLMHLTMSDGGTNWGYQSGPGFSGPDNWKTLASTSCGGVRQSPINIATKDAQYMDVLKVFTLTKGQTTGNVILKTSATSISLSFSSSWSFSFSGTGCFAPVSIHWHWGSKDSQGSEHTIDGTQYPIEGHLVTYNCNLYGNSADATIYPSGLYVFGILYSVGTSNPVLDKIMPYMDTVFQNGNATIAEISPMDFLPQNLGSYYRYEGSLTTPPCTENVIWTVFKNVLSISTSQLAQFRLLKFGHPQTGFMVDNFRPVIPLTATSDYIKRVVYQSSSTRHKYEVVSAGLFAFIASMIIRGDVTKITIW